MKKPAPLFPRSKKKKTTNAGPRMKLLPRVVLVLWILFRLGQPAPTDPPAFSASGPLPAGTAVTSLTSASIFSPKGTVALSQDSAELILPLNITGTCVTAWRMVALVVHYRQALGWYQYFEMDHLRDIEEIALEALTAAQMVGADQDCLRTLFCPVPTHHVRVLLRQERPITPHLTRLTEFAVSKEECWRAPDHTKRALVTLPTAGFAVLRLASGLTQGGLAGKVIGVLTGVAASVQMGIVQHGQDKRIRKLYAMINEIEDDNAWAWKQDERRRKVFQFIDGTRDEVTRVHRALDAALAGRFPALSMPPTDTKKAINAINDRARTHDRSTPLSVPADLAKLKASVFLNTTDYTAYIIGHVPLAHEESVMALYKFISLPLRNEHDAGFLTYDLQDEGYLAVRENPFGNFRAISHAEYSRCVQFSTMKSCPLSSIKYSDAAPAIANDPNRCLYALRTHRYDDSKASCPIKRAPRSRGIVELENNVFGIFSSDPYTMTISCPSKTPERFNTEATVSNVVDLVKVTLAVDCRLTSGWFSVRGSAGTHIRYKAKPVYAADRRLDNFLLDSNKSSLAILGGNFARKATNNRQETTPRFHTGINYFTVVLSLAIVAAVAVACGIHLRCRSLLKKFRLVDENSWTPRQQAIADGTMEPPRPQPPGFARRFIRFILGQPPIEPPSDADKAPSPAPRGSH